MQAFNLEVIGKPVGILCNKYASTLKFSVCLLHLLPAGGAGQLGLHVLHGHLQYHHCQLQPRQLPRLPHQVEPGHGGDVCPEHGGGQGQVPASVLRAGGAAPWCALWLILDLLATTWSSTDLCNKDIISKPSSISLSKIEWSTAQVIMPMDLESLSKWTGHIPGDVSQDMVQITPMLAWLSYDPYTNPTLSSLTMHTRSWKGTVINQPIWKTVFKWTRIAPC